jgi:D-sedoheptulose 7-phosphate isomerase
VTGYFGDYKHQIAAALDTVDEAAFEQASAILWDCYANGRRLILCGNGGSAATASHMVADFGKCIFEAGGKPWEVMCLTDNAPTLTAWSNDLSYESALSKQMQVWGRCDDVSIAISGSGCSLNIISVCKQARVSGMVIIGVCGLTGGYVKQMSDCPVHVASESMQACEDSHSVILHALFSKIRDRVKTERLMTTAGIQCRGDVKQTSDAIATAVMDRLSRADD